MRARRVRVSRRTLHAWAGIAMLVGIILAAYGLDFEAALWGDYHGPVFQYTPSDGAHDVTWCGKPGQPAC